MNDWAFLGGIIVVLFIVWGLVWVADEADAMQRKDDDEL